MSFFIFFCYNFIGDFMNFEKIKELITKNDIQSSIGTKQERTLHQYLKYYFCNESIFHEQKCCGYIVDILKDNQIIEIQTSSFNAMRKKLACLLNKYPITIVYPIINQKLIYNLDENGELISIKKSPKKENPLKIGKELYKINNLLNHPNLKFCYDSGHHNIWMKNIDLLEKYGDRLVSLHLHSNMGKYDSHSLSKQGNIDWDKLAQKLANLPQVNLDYELLMKEKSSKMSADKVLNECIKEARYLQERIKYYKNKT
jgi:hypothetical protein